MRDTILIVEDSKTVGAAFKKAIAKICPDYALQIVDNLADAKRVFLEGNTAAIVTDNDYPKTSSPSDARNVYNSGMQLMEFVRKDQKRDVPIVFATAARNEYMGILRVLCRSLGLPDEQVKDRETPDNLEEIPPILLAENLMVLQKNSPNTTSRAADFIRSKLPARETHTVPAVNSK